jgi:hypothetical protein
MDLCADEIAAKGGTLQWQPFDSVVALNLDWLIAPQFRHSADLRRHRHSGTGSNPFDL